MVRFASKHRLLFFLLGMLPSLCLLAMILLLAQELLTVFIVFLALYTLYILGLTFTAGDKLIMEAAKSYNEACDPEPLLAEAVGQLGYTKEKRKNRRFVLLLHQAIALHSRGRYEEEKRILSGLSSEGVTVIPDLKVNYYCALTELSLREGKTEAAKIYLGKAKENAALVKNKKRLAVLCISTTDCEAGIALKEGRYADARALLAPLRVTVLCQRVGVAMTYGEIAFGEGKMEEAREHFHFVIQNGGKFYSVQLAKEYLRRLEMPSA